MSTFSLGNSVFFGNSQLNTEIEIVLGILLFLHLSTRSRMHRCKTKLNQTFKTYLRENSTDSYIKQRAFLHTLRYAKCSVPLVVNKEIQMSAVFNVREGMCSAGKSEMVFLAKHVPGIFFLQLHCRETYFLAFLMGYIFQITTQVVSKEFWDYCSYQHISYIFQYFRIETTWSFNFNFILITVL